MMTFPIVIESKHQPGRHDQKTHGKKGAVPQATQSQEDWELDSEFLYENEISSRKAAIALGLSLAEYKAIARYTDEGYLRMSERQITLVNAALDKLPLYEGTTRSFISFGRSKGKDQFFAEYKDKKTFSPNDFLSTSKNQGWLHGEARSYVFLEISGNSGRDISAISLHPEEQEVIFRPGTQFNIESIEENFDHEYGYGTPGAKLVLTESVQKHLPGRHDQQRHAGDEARISTKVTRRDTDEDWQALGLKRPTDEELTEAYGGLYEGQEITVILGGKLNDASTLGIYSHDRESGADLDRWVQLDETDQPLAIHVNLDLPKSMQKNGLGTDMLQRAEGLYEKIGIKKIQLHANSQVGKYAWARLGFDFDGEDTRLNVAERFYQYLTVKGVPDDDWPDVKHAWEIAAYTHPKGSGRDFLLSKDAPSYPAVKNLDENDLGYQVGEAYYRAREEANR